MAEIFGTFEKENSLALSTSAVYFFNIFTGYNYRNYICFYIIGKLMSMPIQKKIFHLNISQHILAQIGTKRTYTKISIDGELQLNISHRKIGFRIKTNISVESSCKSLQNET